MNLAELFAKAATDRDDEPNLTDAQTVTRLQEIFALRAETVTLTPGQVILHKYPSMANTKDAEKPAIFVRYLDKPIMGIEMPANSAENQGDFKMALTQDCVVLFVSHGRAVEFLQDSRDYKPHPDFPSSQH